MRENSPITFPFDALLFTLLTSFYMLTQGYALAMNILLIGAIAVYWVSIFIGVRTIALRYISIAVVVGVVIGWATVNVVLERAATEPYLFAHDGLIQSEEATRMILEGKNPYVEDFTNTPMALWDFHVGDLTVNPSLYHYPYMPLTFLLSAPIQALLPIRFDQRLMYVALFVGVLLVIPKFASNPAKKLLLLISFSLNPLLVLFMVRQGRNDALVMCFIVLTIYLLMKKRWIGSAIVLALACATKQFAWFFVPFYFLYAAQTGIFKAQFITFIAVFGVIVVPFIVWNPAAFYEDVIAFQSGLLSSSYPIYGLGFGMWLLAFNVIPSHTAAFPFWIFQLGVGLPVLVLLVRRQWKQNTLRQMVLSYAAFFFVISFFARAFNDNYIGFIIALLLIGMLMDSREEQFTNAF